MDKERIIAFIKNHKRQIIVCACGFLSVFIYILPWLVFGEDSYIMIFENIDCETVHVMYFAENFFRWTGTVPEYMGVDVRAMNVFAIAMCPFYLIFGQFVAYVMWDAIVRAAAFAGMYLLTSRALRNQYLPICLLSAFMFAWLPVFTVYGLTIVGLPLLMWAFLNLVDNKKLALSYSLVVFYALSSSLVLFSWYLVPLMFGICFVYFVRDRGLSTHKHLHIAALVLSGLMVLSALKMITLMLSGYQSHREAAARRWTSVKFVPLEAYLALLLPQNLFEGFFNGMFFARPHAGARPTFSGCTVGVATVIALIHYAAYLRRPKHLPIYKVFGLAWIVLIAIFASQLIFGIMESMEIPRMFGLQTFNFNRVDFFAVPAWRFAECIAFVIIYQFIIDLVREKQKSIRAICVNIACVCALAVYTLTDINSYMPLIVYNQTASRYIANFIFTTVTVITLLCIALVLYFVFPRVNKYVTMAGKFCALAIVITIGATTTFFVNAPTYYFGAQSIYGERYEDPFVANWNKLLRGDPRTSNPTYHEFYDTKLFGDIAKAINMPKDTYHTVALGMFPVVLSFNRFHTLDGHVQIYSLERWYELSTANNQEIKKEQDQNNGQPGVMNSWQYWGNQGYLISYEIHKERGFDFCIPKTSGVKVQNYDLNLAPVQTMSGGKPVYLFSAVEIVDPNYASKFVGYFDHPKSYWGIWLYKIV